MEADFWKNVSKKIFWYLKWPRKPQTVEYSTCVSCFNLEKTIRRTISCHKIQSVPIIILKLLPIDSPDVGEPEKYPQLMLEVHTKWFRGSRTSLTLFWKIFLLKTDHQTIFTVEVLRRRIFEKRVREVVQPVNLSTSGICCRYYSGSPTSGLSIGDNFKIMIGTN